MSVHEPTVSAVIAVRNGERYLAEALASIAQQTRQADEVLVVDGGSTDESATIAEHTGARVVQQAGSGIADAYNTAVTQARSDVLAFLSCDDRWTPDKLQVQLAALQASPRLAFCHAHFQYEVEPGFRPPPQLAALVGQPQPGPIMETLVAKRRAFDDVGPFDTAFANAEDVDWLARAKDRDVASLMVPAVLLYKRLHGANLSLNLASNNVHLLKALRQSVQRKRAIDGP
jgi:glycosyltransferase involved in cell wall biosynthesis